MKRNILVAALLLFIIGCTPQQSDQLTQQQKDQIKKELTAVVDSMIARFDRLDVNGGFQYSWDSPEYVAFNADGSRSDFQATKKAAIDALGSMVALKISTVREDFTVLSKDLAICAWAGKEEVTLKSGDKVLYDPDATTLIFRKIADQWKAIYSHESATIVTQKADKK